MTRFTTAAEGLEREVSGQVRITCPADVAEVVIVPLLPRLLARHPSLSVDLEPGETTLDLTRREADLALRTVRPARGDLVVTRLRGVTWVVAAAPGLARGSSARCATGPRRPGSAGVSVSRASGLRAGWPATSHGHRCWIRMASGSRSLRSPPASGSGSFRSRASATSGSRR